MKPFLSEESSQLYSQTVYSCIAIITHIGTMGGGHYVCYCKDVDNIWWIYNDHSVSKVSEKEIKKVQCYVAIYKLNPPTDKSKVTNILGKYEKEVKDEKIEKKNITSSYWWFLMKNLTYVPNVDSGDICCEYLYYLLLSIHLDMVLFELIFQ